MRIVEIMNKIVKQSKMISHNIVNGIGLLCHQLATRHCCHLSTVIITLINDYLSVDGILVNDTEIKLMNQSSGLSSLHAIYR